MFPLPFLPYPLLHHKFENIVIFRSGNLYSLCSPGNQNYQKIIHNSTVVFLLELVVIINESWYNQAYIFLIADFDFFNDKKFKKKISGSAGFLGYKVNISFVAEKLIYSQICGTKVGPSYKKTASYSFQVGNSNTGENSSLVDKMLT